ncbi:hypothetical protein AC630_27650 [Bradyrhizobium sp. AS23.2]|nr:hypothetical protein AC630_27650 [Bradyrhizobium sp. AS23.2]
MIDEILRQSGFAPGDDPAKALVGAVTGKSKRRRGARACTGENKHRRSMNAHSLLRRIRIDKNSLVARLASRNEP